jgi:hypothetical protein
VEAKKIAVIVTDGFGSIADTARQIAAALEGEYRVIRLTAPELQGNEILPADVLFLGCGVPHPPSFAYLEEFFRHINLAGRGCGIFSVSDKAVHYLETLVGPSEMAPVKSFSGEGGAAAVQRWIKEVVA